MSDPRFFFGDQVQKIMYNDNIRRNYPTVEILNQLNLDRIYEIYKERFADADDFTFTFVGNFDHDTMIPLLAKYLGTLPTLPGNETVQDIGIDIVDGAIEKNIKKGKAPKTNVNITYHGDYEWNKKTNYHLKSMVEVMRIKLRESMREDKGGVYGVRVSSDYNKIPAEKYSITISFNSDPDMTEDLLDTALQDIGNMMSNGPEEDNLTKVKETQRQELIKKMKENRFWLNTINGKLKLDENLDSISIDKLDEAQKELTTFDIMKAARKFFNAQQRVQVVMEPAEQLNN